MFKKMFNIFCTLRIQNKSEAALSYNIITCTVSKSVVIGKKIFWGIHSCPPFPVKLELTMAAFPWTVTEMTPQSVKI